MSLPDRRRFLLLLALGGCGFVPANGPGGPASALRGQVRAADPGDGPTFAFVQEFEARLGRPATPRYDLLYRITTERIATGLTADNRTTRHDLVGAAEYTLQERATGRVIGRGRVRSFTGYAATGSTVAGLAAEDDAMRRLMRILADQVVTRLMAHVAAGADAGPGGRG